MTGSIHNEEALLIGEPKRLHMLSNRGNSRILHKRPGQYSFADYWARHTGALHTRKLTYQPPTGITYTCEGRCWGRGLPTGNALYIDSFIHRIIILLSYMYALKSTRNNCYEYMAFYVPYREWFLLGGRPTKKKKKKKKKANPRERRENHQRSS